MDVHQSAFLLELLVLLRQHFQKCYPSNTSNPSSNPEQLELHLSYSNTPTHDVDAHAYYSNSVVTRALGLLVFHSRVTPIAFSKMTEMLKKIMRYG